jgi:hypothetical protein
LRKLIAYLAQLVVPFREPHLTDYWLRQWTQTMYDFSNKGVRGGLFRPDVHCFPCQWTTELRGLGRSHWSLALNLPGQLEADHP